MAERSEALRASMPSGVAARRSDGVLEATRGGAIPGRLVGSRRHPNTGM
ncbi:hypothetical protein [Haloarcula salinisoli]|uniref:Uncharacterized protein n=1 Tax=Haloarcula salinisoli TaxID=2487746 RepID=A0A8J7YJI4_9EURY|nr:hypothetical protein [Halomicroarcula salinisoli]MBX0304471.1 hypothetical protein [Halomicroarcula salinisoli]